MKRPIPLAFALLAALPLAAMAQEVSFSNSQLVLPLAENTSIRVNAEGEFRIDCEMDDYGGCEGIGGGSGGSKAGATLARQGSGTVEAGGSITLSWVTSNLPGICVATSTPSHPQWNGAVGTAGGAVSFILSSKGNHVFELSCYNDAGSQGPVFVSVDVAGENDPDPPPPPPADPAYCQGITQSPYVMPPGFTLHDVSWETAFYGHSYPNTGAPLAPVGAWTLRDAFPTHGPAMNGRILVIPFVPSGSRNWKLEWALVQPVAANGYYLARKANEAFVAISPCRGDVRPANDQSSDRYLWRGCRKSVYQSSLYYGPDAASTQNVCQIEPGRQYYLMVMFDNPADGLSPASSTCAPSHDNRCEINMAQR